MTFQERLKVYEDQHAELKGNIELGIQNLHRLEGAMASVKDQIEDEAKAAATVVGDAAKTVVTDAKALEGEHLAPGE